MKKVVCLLGLFATVALGSMYATAPPGSKIAPSEGSSLQGSPECKMWPPGKIPPGSRMWPPAG